MVGCMSLFTILRSASLEISDNIIELKSKKKTVNYERDGATSIIIPTEFKNSALIEQALFKYGLKTAGNKDDLNAMLEKGSIRFQLNQNTFDMILTGNFDDDETKSLYENITREYKKMVQEDTYNKVLERLKSRNMAVENEVITEDDSIVLTVTL